MLLAKFCGAVVLQLFLAHNPWLVDGFLFSSLWGLCKSNNVDLTLGSCLIYVENQLSLHSLIFIYTGLSSLFSLLFSQITLVTSVLSDNSGNFCSLR